MLRPTPPLRLCALLLPICARSSKKNWHPCQVSHMPGPLRLFVHLLTPRLLRGLRSQFHLHLPPLSATTWPRWQRRPPCNHTTLPGALPAQYVSTVAYVVISLVSAAGASMMNDVAIPPMRETMCPDRTPTFQDPIYPRHVARPHLRCPKTCPGLLAHPVVVPRLRSAVLHRPCVLPPLLSTTIRKTRRCSFWRRNCLFANCPNSSCSPD